MMGNAALRNVGLNRAALLSAPFLDGGVPMLPAKLTSGENPSVGMPPMAGPSSAPLLLEGLPQQSASDTTGQPPQPNSEGGTLFSTGQQTTARAQDSMPLTGEPALKPPEQDQAKDLRWADGGKFGVKDAIGLALMSLGGGNGIVQNTITDAKKARTALETRERLSEAFRREGFTDSQIELALTNPEAFGSNFNQRFGTRSVADGTAVVSGGPDGQQPEYYQRDVPEYEGYANFVETNQGAAERLLAAEDYLLRGNGPAALGYDMTMDDHRTSNDVDIENLRQRNRAALEGTRQGNRMTLRQTPAPPRVTAPRLPTATGQNGEKYVLRNNQWVPQ